MSRRKVLTTVGVATVAVASLPAIGLTQGGSASAPDLAVSAASEPPDFELAGGRFRIYITVSNQGRARAGVSRAAAFLSSDQERGDDIALGTRRIPAIRPRSQATRNSTLNIPENTSPGFYYLIVCADGTRAVRESAERNNCYVGGQQVGIDATPETRGRPGPPGPTGPQGERGPSGPDYGLIRVPRTLLQFGQPTVDDAVDDQTYAGGDANDGDPDEGSSSQTDLLTVGPITFRALCRQEPDNFASNSNTTAVEAKILVNTSHGTMSFKGANGPRGNIPAGDGRAGDEGVEGGEGKRQVLSVEGSSVGGASFRSTLGGFVSHSDGTYISLQGLYGGINVMGSGRERCIFGGAVRVIQP